MVAKSFIKITRFLEEKKETDKIPALMNAVPNELKDNPYILSTHFNYMKSKKWGEKEIVYYCFDW